jgi:hypothetical protein
MELENNAVPPDELAYQSMVSPVPAVAEIVTVPVPQRELFIATGEDGRLCTVTLVVCVWEFWVPKVGEVPHPTAKTEILAVPEKEEFQVTVPLASIVPADAGLIDQFNPLYPEVPLHTGADVDVVNVEVPDPIHLEIVPCGD